MKKEEKQEEAVIAGGGEGYLLIAVGPLLHLPLAAMLKDILT